MIKGELGNMNEQFKEFVVKDSGERQSFETGMVRDIQEGKPRIDLISPLFLTRLGTHLAKGAEKYSENNWMKGQPYTRALASICRHLVAYQMGKVDEDHLAAIAFGVMALCHYEETKPELDDRVKYESNS